MCHPLLITEYWLAMIINNAAGAFTPQHNFSERNSGESWVFVHIMAVPSGCPYLVLAGAYEGPYHKNQELF